MESHTRIRAIRAKRLQRALRIPHTLGDIILLVHYFVCIHVDRHHRHRRHHEDSKKTKTETITKPKTVNDLGEDLPIFSAVSNVDLENLNPSITTNIKDLLAVFIQYITI